MKIKFSLFFSLFILLSSSSLFSGVEPFLQPCGNKNGFHRMKNIDFIYMINLDHRPEKYAKASKALIPYGILPYRFSAVSGSKLSLKTINSLGVSFDPSKMLGNYIGTYFPDQENGNSRMEPVTVKGRTYFCQSMTRGPIGCLLSHLSVLQDAYKSGYETIWIMEDDVEIIRNPTIIPDLLNKLDLLVGKKGWDVLFTDQDTKDKKGNYVRCLGYGWRPNYWPQNPSKLGERQNISADFRKIGARYGSYSMIIRRSGICKLLEYFKKYNLFLPYDMDYSLVPDINMFTVIDDVVSTEPTAISDNDAIQVPPKSFPCFKDCVEQTKMCKQLAFQVMPDLQGWCSNSKAEYLIDFIILSSPKTVVEIGVFGGKSLIPMAIALRSNCEGKIYGIDPWSPEASKQGLEGVDREWWGQVNHQAVLEQLQQKIQTYALDGHVELIRSTSADANLIPNIDLLHVDGNHSEDNVYIDVTKWVPSVRRGGLIILNDVNWASMTKAIEWLDFSCTKVAIYSSDSDYWGVWIKN